MLLALSKFYVKLSSPIICMMDGYIKILKRAFFLASVCMWGEESSGAVYKF